MGKIQERIEIGDIVTIYFTSKWIVDNVIVERAGDKGDDWVVRRQDRSNQILYVRNFEAIVLQSKGA